VSAIRTAGRKVPLREQQGVAAFAAAARGVYEITFAPSVRPPG
jgi:hypothetical protein